MNRRRVMGSLVLGLACSIGLGWQALGDEMLLPPADAESKLTLLLSKRKFLPEPTTLYTGVKDAAEREAAEAAINQVIRSTIDQVRATPRKQSILRGFKSGLDEIDLTDTEDRERAATYIEEIMDCIGLESSDGLLNTWMYGFDPHSPPAG